MNKIPDLPPASGAPAPEGTSKRARLSADIDVESMPINQRLEKALVLQLLTAQELQKAVLDDDEATPTQKSQVTNTLSQVIETLAKLQIKLFSAERMKDIEGVLIDTVNDHMTPEQANHFMGEYRRRLGASQE
jgi:hypothetical protein